MIKSRALGNGPGLILAPLFLLFCFFLAASSAGSQTIFGTPPEGLTITRALQLGQAMYRRGILPSGEPMLGFVQGDIEVSGRILTCSNCHMRSGLGSYEGGITTLPTNGAKLYAPLDNGYDLPSTNMGVRPLTAPRPAYTDETLEGALLEGVDAAGRVMSWTMPRYVLDDRDLEILVFYLKNLSSSYSPGATPDLLRLATVVSEGLSSADRQSLLVPLKSFVTRFPRKLSLDVWELKGPRETWKEQLENYYQKQPVFALLSGLVEGSWEPVHRFCEEMEIPAIFPVTDLPVVSESDLYTLYFSKGYYQEGEAAAKYLAHVAEVSRRKRVVQVFEESEEGRALTDGFSETWSRFGLPETTRVGVPKDQKGDVDYWQNLVAKYPNSILLLWLRGESLGGFESLGSLLKKTGMVFVSSTLLNHELTTIPEQVRGFTYITYPYGLPEERAIDRTNVAQFWRGRNIHPQNREIGEKVYSGVGLFSLAMGGLNTNRYRDFLLDLFDMMEDQIGFGVRYPRLSFGPGQRYASKGCYIVKFDQLVKKSEWIVY